VGEPLVGEVSATVRAESLGDPPLEPPSSFAIPTTSRAAIASTINRRIQYTRAGSGPRVIPAMAER
jgi:hypothetical protein